MKSSRRTVALVLAVALMFPLWNALGENELAFVSLPDVIRPGKLVLMSFTSPASSNVDIHLVEGDSATELFADYPAKEGQNSISWDGLSEGQIVKPGTYKLAISNGTSTTQADIVIGEESPVLSNVLPSDTTIIPGTPWSIHVEANMQGTLSMRLEEQDTPLYEGNVEAGEADIPWDGLAGGQALTPGEHTLVLTLADSTGFLSNAQYIPVEIGEYAGSTDAAGASTTTAAPEITDTPENASTPEPIGGKAVAPVNFSPYPANGELNYWTLPMDLTDEASIWEVMTQSITVLDGNQKAAYKLRAKPEADAEPVGEITYESQGVRVLETLDNGWSLIESYSSSFHDSTVKVWGEMVQGYVKTSLLKTKKPSQKYGLIIDKLTQRMYVFKDGKLFSELLISTGLMDNPEKPFTETQAGDYILISWVGKFFSDNLQCEMAIRFNNGNLIHQVPYTLRADGSKYFDKTEPKLGTKASHGCVRVQRKKNPEGVNMAWLWNNLEQNTRVLIWEDYKGRQIAVPSADTKLYYNPNGGTYYHSNANCLDVRAQFLPLTAFNYGQLEEGSFAGLTRCPACAPPLRAAEIEAVNAAHAN